MQRMATILILCVNVNIPIDAMLKFDVNADANVDVDAKCKRTIISIKRTILYIYFHADLQVFSECM